MAGQVGRGSFVTGDGAAAEGGVNWPALLAPAGSTSGFGREEIGFVMSRPSRDLFPLDDFRASCAAVLGRADLADILQLGSPSGYEPLRRRLLDEARAEGLAGPGDDLIITNGCQQALDLIGRVLVRPGDPVAVEDPIYPGLKNLLTGMGAQLVGIPVGADGLEVGANRTRAARAAAIPGGHLELPEPDGSDPAARGPARSCCTPRRSAGVPVVENDAYGELRYSGEPLPALKQLDETGGTVLLRSFSKVSFPGLRVGWALGPKPLIDRLRQAKEAADLHTDQLSQAVLLEFVESGRLEAHRGRVRTAGAERLAATLDGCRRYLPPGARWTRAGRRDERVGPAAGAARCGGVVAARAQKEGVAYFARPLFRGRPARSGGAAVEFRRPSAGADPGRLAVLGRILASEMEAAENTAPRRPWFNRLWLNAERRRERGGNAALGLALV